MKKGPEKLAPSEKGKISQNKIEEDIVSMGQKRSMKNSRKERKKIGKMKIKF